MELMSAEELYEISCISQKKEESIADRLLRAARNGSVELLVDSLDEATIKKLEDKGFVVREIYFYISEAYYRFRICWGKDALDVADKMAEETTERYTHKGMFSKLMETVND